MPSGSADSAESLGLLRLLIADDDADDISLCLHALKSSAVEFQSQIAQTRDDFINKLEQNPVDIVLADYRMKGWTGMDALAVVQKLRPEVPVILLSGTLGDELAVDCIKKGITDYVLKHQLARLPVALRRAREEKDLRQAQMQAVHDLRESEQRYRTLVENAPEAIVVFDMETCRFVDCNRHALSLFGLIREQLLASTIKDVIASWQPDGRWLATIQPGDAAESLWQTPPSFEWMCRHSDGHEIPCEVYLAHLPSHASMLVRGSIVDITQRKQAEHALRSSEARFRALVDNATTGIYWVTQQGELLYANPALVRMLAYDSAEELLRERTTENIFRYPAERARIYAEYFQNKRLSATVEWRRKDGKIITVRITGRRAEDPEKGRECAEVLVEDITERIALEKQLQQAQKFEAFGQLAGGIAHDFNNMIGAIIGWADLGCDESEKGARLHRHFEKIHQQADRAAALTRQLLAFARRQILTPRNMDLNAAVVETISLLDSVIGSNIDIRADLAPDLKVICADPTQVEQVLLNLCINARDAMPHGGSILIKTSNIVLDEAFCVHEPLTHIGAYVTLAVTDTGSGMDAATLDRIFEPFFTTKELGKGTGLGLATVYGILTQHGGFVQVNSELGKGTTFRAYLPASATTSSSQVTQITQSVRGGSETILIVEDHEGLQQIARETLVNLGYEVLLAADGEQALREFQDNGDKIQLVLLDVVLPKLSGPEVYFQIAAQRPDLPVIFATGYSPDISQLEVVQSRGLPLLQKPYSSRDLARKVRETLDRWMFSALGAG